MTQEMYGATGRVGNKTYYRSNGKTIAREAITPKNPKTHSLSPPEGMEEAHRLAKCTKPHWMKERCRRMGHTFFSSSSYNFS